MATDAATNARKAALEALQPVADDPSIRPIILALGGEGEGEDVLEKAMTRIGEARSALIKDDGVNPAEAFRLGQKLDAAERSLQTEYMRRHSVGFAKAEAANAEAARLREANFGRAA